MRTSALVAALAAALAVALAPAGAETGAPLLGIVLDGGQGHLGRLDPETLRPLQTSAFLTNGYAVAPALSPDGAKVALGSTSFFGVRVVDLVTLKADAEIRVPVSGAHVVATAWSVPGRLAVGGVRCCPSTLVLANIDPAARTVVWTKTVVGTPLAAARTAGGLAFLVAPATGIGPARLVVAEPQGVRVVKLTVRAGRAWPAARRGPLIGTQRIPGLAVDPAAARAYVFAPEGGVSEVALQTGRVSSHTLARRTISKALTGPDRDARWLGNGLVALTGVDEHVRTSGTSITRNATPAGLALVDVREWTSRLVDRDATSVTVGDGLLFTRGDWDASPRPIRAYDFSGRLRFELADLAPSDWLQTAGDRAYVAGRVLELPSGRMLRRLATDVRVTLLATDGSQFPL
jgi:hypothetical protein